MSLLASFLVLGVAGCFAAGRGDVAAKGWIDANHDRRVMPASKILWQAELSAGDDCLTVERRNGAEGTVSVTNGVITIDKSNDRGEIFVKTKPFAVKRRGDVRMSARAASQNATPLLSRARLALVADKGAALKCLDGMNFGSRGPRACGLVNTPPGTDEIRFGHFRCEEDGMSVTPTIVIGGPASTSCWRAWQAEDFAAAQKEWERAARKANAKDSRPGALSEEEFAKLLADEPDHTAAVVKVDGIPRLLVDGEVHEPVFYKGRHVGFSPLGDCVPSEGRRMQDVAEVDLQVAFVVGGRTHNYPKGFWTREGYDVHGAVESVRTAMRISPKAKFVLSLMLVPYPEFAREHPDEAWRTADGKIAYGNESCIYGTAESQDALPPNRWAWISYASPAFRAAVKRNLAALVAELKRTGLAKRVVGIHTCGFRDWQFAASNYPDHSETMKRAWRERGAGRSFEAFRQAEGCAVQNEVARFAKQCFGKDIVAVRWCFSAFSGEYTGSYDIGEFCRSDALDILVAQAMYVHRGPAVPLGLRLPVASFAEHGKLFVNEFDLRTERSLNQVGSSEADAIGMGLAKGLDMWRSVYRRAAGQMIARQQGWWFYDMSGSWYDTDELAEDIAASVRTCRDVLKADVSAWRPNAAVLIDEQGSLEGIAANRPDRDFNLFHAVFAASGVPYEQYLADDWVTRPELSDGFRLVVWFGVDRLDVPRQRLLDRLEKRGVRVVLPAELMKTRSADLFRMAREAGAFVPCDRPGLQIDMNAAFVSVHCLVPGRYDFRLPFAAALKNEKSGEVESTTGTLKLEMQAGETRWYGVRACPKGL